MKYILLACLLGALSTSSAHKLHNKKESCSPSDKYCDTNEYDTEFASEAQKGGYDATPVDNFSKKEDAALPTQLDGEALIQEIDAKNLNLELNTRENGAGIKNKEDLQDLLSSIKGADVFINRTPKEQL